MYMNIHTFNIQTVLLFRIITFCLLRLTTRNAKQISETVTPFTN